MKDIIRDNTISNQIKADDHDTLKRRAKLLQTLISYEYDYVAELDLDENSYDIIVENEGRKFIPETGLLFDELTSGYGANVLDDANRCLIREKMDRTYIRQRLSKDKSYMFDFKMKDSDNKILYKRMRVFFSDEESGKVGFARYDMTDAMEDEIRKNEILATALNAAEQANTAKSDFLSRMSHEIRTPMNAIIGMATIAAQSLGDNAQVADCISKIGISSRFLLSLINDILDMSRIESGRMFLNSEDIPIEDFIAGINAICYTQAEAKNIDYECIVDSSLADFYVGDPMKLQQVIINIVSNAIKFTPDGGRVTFSVQEHRKDKNTTTLRFVINDTGCGISEDFMPHLYEPFSQEHENTVMYSGTGLGLAISKSLVDMMNGRIYVRSIVGVGTEFTVDVKLGVSEESRKREHERKSLNFADLSALVVDDDIIVCEQAEITLSDMGVKTEWVDSGYKAVTRVRDLWAQKKSYDLILIDWKMPDMDGIETARRIREIVGPDVTIIIMTAYEWRSIEHEARRAGVNMLISKPMFRSTLVSAFQKAFNQNEEKIEPSELENFDFTGKRVLLTEDHPLNVEVAKKLLESKGFDVECAENGVQALEMMIKSPDGYYDAILMDIRMPEMNGLQAANAIRKLSSEWAKKIPIIAMTANAFEEDIEKSKKAGMNAHLAKPIDSREMFRLLYKFIYQKDDSESFDESFSE